MTPLVLPEFCQGFRVKGFEPARLHLALRLLPPRRRVLLGPVFAQQPVGTTNEKTKTKPHTNTTIRTKDVILTRNESEDCQNNL